jgi:hypothetical protein
VTATRRSLATLAVAWAWLMLVPASPARAHHGYAGPVRLYLETVRLEPRGQEWHLRAGVNDSGTGKPASGFVVDASGSGPQGTVFGPVHMADPDADGRYDAALGPLPVGDWSVTVNVSDAPGSEERAVPVTRTWRLALQPGPALELVGRQTTLDTERPGSSSSSSGAGVIATALAIGGLAVLLGLAVVLVRRRHRTPALPAS